MSSLIADDTRSMIIMQNMFVEGKYSWCSRKSNLFWVKYKFS